MHPDEKVGLLVFLSKTPGVGGTIKEVPEDFLVEEITPEGIVLEIGKSQKFKDKEGEYIHFTLEKNNWDTMRAIKVVSKRCSVSQKRLKYAGTKDRRSISAQRVSIWNVPKEKLEKVNIKDITLRDFSTSDEPINLGSSSGNRFTITIKGVEKGTDKKLESIAKEMGGKAPNFFGTQRFGLCMNNHLIGKHVLTGEFKEAVMAYLCDAGNEREEAIKAKESLRKTEDFKQALLDFPDYLGFEKSILNHLIKEPTDFIGSMRTLPKKLRWMFVHAYQGYIFNRALSEYIKEKNIPEELPLVGYASKPDNASKKVLKEDGISLNDFNVASMPEMSSEGKMRQTLVEFKDFEVLSFNEKDSNIRVRFSLPPGAYATMLLREMMK